MNLSVNISPVFHQMEYFAQMLQDCCGLSMWCFGREKKLLDTTCTEPKTFLLFLELSKCLDFLLADPDRYKTPVLMEDAIGMLWAADFLRNGSEPHTNCILVLGPVFNSASSLQMLRDSIQNLHFSEGLNQAVQESLLKVPVMSTSNFNQFIRMLHWNMTGEVIKSSEILVQQHEQNVAQNQDTDDLNPERSFYVEERLLQLIREGNPGYKVQAESLIESVPQGVMRESGLRKNQNTVIIFTALAARAAVQGGVAPRTAARLQDYYVQEVERCRHYTNLLELNKEMLDDFINQVQHAKRNKNMSRTVRECCEYLQLHLKEPFELEKMARTMGYTEYYLSKKFARETGQKISTYLRTARLEQARIMLVETDSTIQQISEELQFSSRNYFTKVFTQVYGVSPQTYREKYGVDDHED